MYSKKNLPDKKQIIRNLYIIFKYLYNIKYV